ncbi:4Fe-4S dicluster domain-containing protein [Spirosoma pollinicola]|uniref:4Fe-4S ferredoxin n=1 Tax=Spirosoma pollinicola TaxID=2057025 RepID=A0A2K8Z5C5_9BACT|nr:4Fe-4S dicluster domain-containing protein [Spirosoma pollinicola]AUD05075.1 4Fe-4S ferredoxin [Spirosoma pollinicola]
MSYFKDIQSGIRTTIKGLSLTLRHLRNATKRRSPEGIENATYFDLQNGLVTLQYPHEQLPIPDNGRYQLRNEIEDCIVCDKCAKICPVDCITIDAIKATEEVGRASDGSPIRLYAAKFDIDMAKCCYCGLCTVVCPTECLTMDKKFDYSEFDLGKLTYHFSELTPEQADEKRALYEQYVREKEEAKAAQVTAKAAATPQIPDTASVAPTRPVFRPTAKPSVPAPPPAEPANSEGSSIEHPLTDATPDEMQHIAQGGLETTKRPVFKPTQKPVIKVTDVPADETPTVSPEPTETLDVPEKVAKPAAFRPTMKPPVSKPVEPAHSVPVNDEEPKPKPAFRPTMKPPRAAEIEPKVEPETSENTDQPKPKAAAFRPTMKPDKPVESEPKEQPEAPKPKPAAFRPTMKPATAAPKPVEESISTEAKEAISGLEIEPPKELIVELTKPKAPAFRPTMKPKPKPDDEASA